MRIWVFHLLHVLINRSHQNIICGIKPGCELNRFIIPSTQAARSKYEYLFYPLVLRLKDKSPLADLS
jgi:hypothetical protein